MKILAKQNIRFKKKNKQLKTQLDIANKKLEEQDNRINKTIEYLQKERNNYYEQGIKLAETNLENILVSASLCTCDNALSIIGDKDEK